MNTVDAFFRYASESPEHPALFVSGEYFSYGELAWRAGKIARWLRNTNDQENIRVGIWADRTLASYLGILGTLWAGFTYVPLSPRMPAARLIDIIEQSGISALVVKDHDCPLFKEEIRDLLPPEILTMEGYNRNASTECSLAGTLLKKIDPIRSPVKVKSNSYCYIMFTSGTTGRPKGVPVTVGNVKSFIKSIKSRYRLGPDDRFSQYNELTFDLSIFDILMAWEVGATLYSVPVDQVLSPINFISLHKLTVWFSVPSLIGLLGKFKLLKKSSLPSLRYSLFCGEPFFKEDAELWRQSAISSVVENLYGPTEATVACSGSRLLSGKGTGKGKSPDGIMSIGKPLSGMHFAVIDQNGDVLPNNRCGELVIAGPQVTPGYLDDSLLTRKRYRRLRNVIPNDLIWYCTGDRVYRDSCGEYYFVGRLDNQVKIGGYRVELEEVETRIREVVGCGNVVCSVILDKDSQNQILYAAICKNSFADSEIKRLLRLSLPSYMIPHEFIRMEFWPRTTSGKIDRKKIQSMFG